MTFLPACAGLQVFGASRAKHTSEAGAQAFGIGPFPRVRQVKKVKVGGKAWQMATTGLRTHSEKQKQLSNASFSDLQHFLP